MEYSDFNLDGSNSFNLDGKIIRCPECDQTRLETDNKRLEAIVKNLEASNALLHNQIYTLQIKSEQLTI